MSTFRRWPLGLPDTPGTGLGHKTKIPVLGSKQWLNVQGRREGLAGDGSGAGISQLLLGPRAPFLGSLGWLPPGALAASWPLPL